MANLSLNTECSIAPFKDGIKLIRPDDYSFDHYPDTTIKNLLKIPANIYFLNPDSECQLINDVSAETMGFTSAQNSIGKTIFDIAPRNIAVQIINTDKIVLEQQRLCVVEDVVTYLHSYEHRFLTVKKPMYDSERKIIGIFGCSLIVNDTNFITALNQIIKLGFLQKNIEDHQRNDYFKEQIIGGQYFTKRELEIIYLTNQAYTAKEIASFLKISSRTVEAHLENAKQKVNVNSKRELLEFIKLNKNM